ncbi:serine/threonine protein kinase [Sphaerisporangium rufum]|uniref:serine/threonine protein kinase n=1 Tax=Sphaerisporangium rufum TaxID=1381558 RepID=UPI001EF2D2A5|nr:serine/threonine-protein kinase [Sphaerisporangium rufum]
MTQGPRGTTYIGHKADEASDGAAEPAPEEAPGAPAPKYVVKLLPPWPDADDQARERVLADLSAGRRVTGRNVAATVEAGWSGDRAYIVREYVEGRSLREAVEADGPPAGDELQDIAAGILTALTAVHHAGISHRGLTPDNVFLGADGPLVADFGLGETGYRSPEQVRGEVAGPAADLFAWASTVLFAATGTEPFDDAAAVGRARPDLGALPEPLREVVAACLARIPGVRPTSQGAVLWLLGDSGPAVPLPPVAPVQPAPPLRPAAPAAVTPPPGAPAAPDGRPVLNAPAGGSPVPDGPARPPVMPAQRPDSAAPAAVWTVPAQPPAPAPKVWNAPALPPGEPPSSLPPAIRGATPEPAGAPAPGKRPGARFPVGLVAGVGVVFGLAGVGLWGAGNYAKNPEIKVAAEGAPAGVGADAAQGTGTDTGQAGTGERPEVTVPWAASPDPRQTGVYPMRLDTPSPPVTVPTLPPGQQFTPPAIPTTSRPATPGAPASPTPASPTPAPTVTVTATPSPTAIDPTPAPTETPQPTGSGTPAPSPSATPAPSGPVTPSPTPTVTGPVTPAPTPTPGVTRTATPQPTVTRTATPRPTVTRTWSPRPTRTASPRPTVTRTVTPRPTASAGNPYTPQQVCNSGGRGGFTVQRSSAFSGGVVYQLGNGAGAYCVVTMKTQYVGVPTSVSATLEVSGAAPASDSGAFKHYAGPVILDGKGRCVRFGGGAGSATTSSACG